MGSWSPNLKVFMECIQQQLSSFLVSMADRMSKVEWFTNIEGSVTCEDLHRAMVFEIAYDHKGEVSIYVFIFQKRFVFHIDFSFKNSLSTNIALQPDVTPFQSCHRLESRSVDCRAPLKIVGCHSW